MKRGGLHISQVMPLASAFDIDPETIGQLIYFGVVGAVIAVLLVAIWFGSNSERRQEIAAYTLLLAALGFFAVVIDGIWGVFGLESYLLYQILGVIEDGGEMLVVSVACWCVLGAYSRSQLSQ